jgi:hypothetical protein
MEGNVHTNRNVQCDDSGNPQVTVQGTVSASGTIANANVTPNPVIEKAPNVAVPLIDARSLYAAEVGKPQYDGQWFDLCPGGIIRAPAPRLPLPAPAPVPCSGTELATGSYQGWRYEGTIAGGVGSRWKMDDGSAAYSGVYYIHEGDAVISPGQNLNKDPAWNATVFASSASSGSDPATCGKVGGNISFLNGLKINNAMTGIVLYADADLRGDQQVIAGSGLFAAGDQVTLNTSSSQLRGAVLAGDQCPPPNAKSASSIQGMTITFDGSIEAPLASLIRTSLWLELVG